MDIIRQLRAEFLLFAKGDRFLWTISDDSTRKEALRFRHDQREWHTELFKLPEFTLATQTGRIDDARELIRTLGDCRLFVNKAVNPKQIHDANKRDSKRREAVYQALKHAESELSDNDAQQVGILAERTESALLKRQELLHVTPDLVGKAGNASLTISGQRSYFVMALDQLVPEINNRYSTIAKLLNHSGLDISRQHVRTIIKERDRFR